VSRIGTVQPKNAEDVRIPNCGKKEPPEKKISSRINQKLGVLGESKVNPQEKKTCKKETHLRQEKKGFERLEKGKGTRSAGEGGHCWGGHRRRGPRRANVLRKVGEKHQNQKKKNKPKTKSKNKEKQKQQQAQTSFTTTQTKSKKKKTQKPAPKKKYVTKKRGAPKGTPQGPPIVSQPPREKPTKKAKKRKPRTSFVGCFLT